MIYHWNLKTILLLMIIYKSKYFNTIAVISSLNNSIFDMFLISKASFAQSLFK